MFDDPNLVGSAGLVPVMGLAQKAGLEQLARQHLSVPGDKGANAGVKVASLVAGMVAGADSIDDMALLRHGGMGRLFSAIYAPSTLGSFLRAFTFGHVRKLDAIASRFLLALAGLTRLLTTPVTLPAAGEQGGLVFVDVDDTVIEVHGHAKQGAGFGYKQDPRPERAAGHRDHLPHRTGDRGPTAPSGGLFLTAGWETSGR